MSDKVVEQYSEYVIPMYAPSVTMVRGQGTRLWDSAGKVYMDFGSGIGALNVGHCHPSVVAAVREQAGELMHVSNLYYNERQAELAARLSISLGGGKCAFVNSGAEANEALFKLARRWGAASGKTDIVTMNDSFHGRTLAAVAATGQEKIKRNFDPLPAGFSHADFNDLDSVRGQVTDKTAAILVEAVQGEGGVVPATAEFMRGLRALCDEKEILLLCDEVQCGMGRTGNLWGFQEFGVEPDAFSTAKALGGGMPIGAIVAGAKLANVFQPGDHASTFGGNPVTCAAAIATLDVIDAEGLAKRAKRVGNDFRAGLQELVDKYEHVTEVRGMGLMLGLVLDQSAKPLVDDLMDIGLIAICTAENVVRFLPPLTVKEGELEEALEIIADCCEEWHNPGAADEDGDDAEETASDEEAATEEEPPTAEADPEPVGADSSE